MADKILEAVSGGNYLTTACAAAGVSRSTLYRWLDRAAAADRTLEAGAPCDEEALAFLHFRDRLNYARAQAAAQAVAVIQLAARGGQVIKETPLQDRRGNVVLNESGEVLYEYTYSKPNGQLALAFLTRLAPDQWGRTGSHKR